MGIVTSKINRWKGRRRVYLSHKRYNSNAEDDDESDDDDDDDDEENDENDKNENENDDDDYEDDGLPNFTRVERTEHFDETANRVNYTKKNIQKQLNTITRQSQQAIIDATVISTRKNTYGNKQTQTDLSPNPYILKLMISRSTVASQEEFVKKNEGEILSQIAILQTIQGYRTNEYVDDQAILHEHEAYFSSMNYYLTNPDQPAS